MLKVKKEIDGSEIKVWLDGELIWTSDFETGLSKIENARSYDKYLKASWKEIDYGETPSLLAVRADLKMKTTTEGGRQTGFLSGLRPNHVFEYENGEMKNTWIGDILFEGDDLIMPGAEREVTVRFHLHMPVEQFLSKGRTWWIHEGARRTGEAQIKEIITTYNKT